MYLQARPRRRRAAALLLSAALLACAAEGGAPAGPAGPTGPTGPSGSTGPTGPTGPVAPAAWITIASAPAGPLAVDLLSDRTLGTGLALLALRVRDGDATVGDAVVTLAAAIGEGGAPRSALVLGGPSPGDAGLHLAEVAFPEPSTPAAGWSAVVGVARPGQARVEVSFAGLAVEERGLARAFASGGRQHLLAARFEAGLAVGLNPVVVALAASDDGGATRVPAAGAVLGVEPFMPSMGHGAAGSVAPAPAGGPGRYRGEVAFSMPGDWEITFPVALGGVEVGRPAVVVWF